MEVAEQVSLCYRGGPRVAIPEALLLTDTDGRKWLKLRPSHPSIGRLVLGHLEEFNKSRRNPSLSQCPQLNVLWQRFKEAIVESTGGEDESNDPFAAAAEEGNHEEENHEGAEIEGAQKNKSWKDSSNLRSALQKAPPSVKVNVGIATAVELKVPKSFKEKEIVCLLTPGDLTALCDFLLQDVHSCFDPEKKKRAYVKTGQYSKKAKSG